MSAEVYEVLSLAMRYVFTFLGVMIVWRSFSWLRKDRRLKHKRLRQLPDAGTIGVLVAVFDAPDLKEGTLLPVPHEGVLGSLRGCDVVVPVAGVAGKHLDFTFVDGEGLYIHPYRGCPCTVDGVELRTNRDSRHTPMQHGSLLTIGETTLRLGVFAGLDVQQYIPPPVQYPPSEEYVPDSYPTDDYFPNDTPYSDIPETDPRRRPDEE